MRGAGTAGLAAAFAVAACSQFGSDSTSSAPSDAGAVDASTQADAGPVAFGSGFCSRHTDLFLCDDFDDGGPLGWQWSETTKTNGGELAYEPSARSGPNALVASSSASGQAWAYVAKDLGTSTNHVILGFDMKLDALGTTYTEGPQIAFGDDATGKYLLTLHVQPNGALSVTETSSARSIAEHAFAKTPVPGQWARIAMEVDLATAPPHLRVTVDEAATPTVDVDLTPAPFTGVRRASVGLLYFLQAGWRASFDNVTIDRK